MEISDLIFDREKEAKKKKKYSKNKITLVTRETKNR